MVAIPGMLASVLLNKWLVSHQCPLNFRGPSLAFLFIYHAIDHTNNNWFYNRIN